MISITLKGEPRSTGHIYKITAYNGYPKMYMSPEGQALKTDYQWQIKQQYRAKPIEMPLEIYIRLYFGTKRKSDWDNFHKLSMDALNKAVWLDDSQIQKAYVEKAYDKENPRIEIDIYPLVA